MAQRIRADAALPKSRSYVFPLIACLVVTGMWTWLLLSRRPATKQLNQGDIVVVCCFFAASALYVSQIIRRLFWPDRVLAGAIAINEWLERKPSPWLEWALRALGLGVMAAMFIGVVSFSSFHLHLRVWMIYGVFFQVSGFLRDVALIGIVADEDTWPKARSVAELKPIRSEHWGQS